MKLAFNPFTSTFDWVNEPVETIDGFTFQNYEKTAFYVYVGYEHADGRWYIYRRTIADNTRGYAYGTSDYSTNWTNRGALSYV
jgi:hypothetical protein